MITPIIHFSTEYSRFKTITGNRNINQNKVKKIISDINDGLNLLAYCPIMVYPEGNDLLVIDGQHRLEVCEKIQGPVYFVETDKVSLQQIAKINSRQEKWSIKDFLNAYIKVGIQDYISLAEVVSDFRVNVSVAGNFLMYNGIKQKSKFTNEFREGRFKVNHLQEVRELLQLVDNLFGIYTFSMDRNLILATQSIKKIGKCEFDVLKEKIKKKPMMMDKQSSVKDYIYNIERIYNHNNQKRQFIS